MILNPVIQGGGAEKVYTIDTTLTDAFPTEGTAGKRISSSYALGGGTGQTIYGEDGQQIPLIAIEKKMDQFEITFIMPDQNITIE